MLHLSKPLAPRQFTAFATQQRACSHCKILSSSIRNRRDSDKRRRKLGKVNAALADHQAPKGYTGLNAKSLFVETYGVFRKLVWPAVWLYAGSELANVILNRITHRLVNGLFLAVQGGAYTPDMLGESLWFLSLNPAITTFASGYNYVSYGLIALTFPLTLLISTIFHVSLFNLAWQVLEHTPPPAPPPPIRAASAPSASPPRAPAAASTPPSTPSSSAAPPQAPSDSSQPVAEAANDPAAPAVATLSAVPGSNPGSAGAERIPADTNNDAGHPTPDSRAQADGASTGASDARSTNHDGAAGTSARGAAPGEVTSLKLDPYFDPSEKKGRLAALRTAMRALSEVLTKWLTPTYMTSCIVGVVEISMLVLSALVLTLPFTVTTWLNVQLAVPLARFEGLRTKAALEKSKELLDGLRRPFGLACGAAFIGHFLSLPAYEVLSQLLPHRIALQVPEIPIALCLGAYCVKFILLHVQWLIPLVFFYKLRKSGSEVATASSAAS